MAARAVLRRLLLPAAILAAVVLADRLWSASQAEWVVPTGRAIYLVGLALAWRFGRGRTAWAILLLGLVAETEIDALLAQGAPASSTALALAALLPLNLAVAAVLRERSVVSWRTPVLLGATMAQGLAIAGLELPAAAGIGHWLRGPMIGLESSGTGNVPPLGVLCFLVAANVLLLCLAWRRTPLEAGLLGALVAAWLALTDPLASSYYLAGGGLVLVVAIIENAFVLAFEDTLTGLPGRRSLEDALAQLGNRYALAIVDIDHFKRVNDRHGHEVGDQVLRMVACRLASLTSGSRAFRYGGEEFVLLFAGRTTKDVLPLLSDLKAGIADQAFTVRGLDRPRRKPPGSRGTSGRGLTLKVTVSIGVAERSSRRLNPEQVLKAADEALYRAKRTGRNRVCYRR